MDDSRHSLMRDLKRRIDKVRSLTVEIFCWAVEILYGNFSDRAAHAVAMSAEIQSTDIIQGLQLIEALPDEPYKKTVEILISSLRLSEDDASPEDSTGV